MNIAQPTNQLLLTIFGIVGTLLGTLMGWVLNNLSQKGKLSFYIITWSNSYAGGISPFGGYGGINNFSEVDVYTYETIVEVYNSSGINKIIRDVSICFFDGKKQILSNRPCDLTTRKTSVAGTIMSEFRSVNILPKTIAQLNFGGSIHKEKLSLLKKSNNVRMLYSDEKGREKRVHLFSEGIMDFLKYINGI
jgi:hypothetical protein